jgi:curved DNA-binding protein CbpA
VREIYRRLATALHPDREPDAAKRERKTRLMQRANRAYESDDLLELLALQIEIGEIDARALASVPDERLRQYNKALREQMWSLEEQVRQHAWTYRRALGIRSYRLTPEDADHALTAHVAEARGLRRTLERDLQALHDPRRRRAFFDALPEPWETEEPSFDELAALAAVLGSPGRKPRAGRRRKRR